MAHTYLAIDIGASSGRLMLSRLNGKNKMSLEEIHRFENGFSEQADGHLYWDMAHLTREILVGLSKVKAAGIDQCYVGIDTWAVDYCLLDSAGQLLRGPISYRDPRTEGVFEQIEKDIPLEDIYQKTGIQLLPFNTLFQLYVEEKDVLKQTDQLLLIPDYLAYLFTGQRVMEKTNASTMQLLDPVTQEFQAELLKLVALKREVFPTLVDPGHIIGTIEQDTFPDYELPCATFIAVASHDTASAVVGTPGKGDNWAYLSSGTWSLLGVELTTTQITAASYQANYTNEWGAFGTIRFLKNIMGLWLVQEIAREFEGQYSFGELAELANQTAFIPPLIDVNDRIFLKPASMIAAIQEYCRKSQQQVPEEPGDLALTVYQNLAFCYALELENLNVLSGRPVEKLQIVGGGSQAALLNQLTANVTNVTVEAGPSEATAIGNILVQMIATEQIGTMTEGRKIVRSSFPITRYLPRSSHSKPSFDDYKTFLS